MVSPASLIFSNTPHPASLIFSSTYPTHDTSSNVYEDFTVTHCVIYFGNPTHLTEANQVMYYMCHVNYNPLPFGYPVR